MLAVLGVLVVSAAASASKVVVPQPLHYAGPVEGTDAFVGIRLNGACFKAYLSDGTGARATLSVWFQGCLAPDNLSLSAERGGVRLDARIIRRRAEGTITLRDGSVHAFSAPGGGRDDLAPSAPGASRGGIVGRRFTYEGRRYRSGWVVLADDQVRWRVTPIGRGLYGDPPPPPADPCAAASGERELLRAQLGLLSAQSGRREVRLNRRRQLWSAGYNRLGQALGALAERISELDALLYGDCRSG
jgi:hypothetical protein